VGRFSRGMVGWKCHVRMNIETRDVNSATINNKYLIASACLVLKSERGCN
jgi:hypothetical protein